MEVRVAVGLEVLRPADSRVRHDRRAAAGLIGGRRVAVPAAAGARAAVERVVPAELVPHLVGDVVDPERVSGRVRASARHALRLPARRADHAGVGDAPASCGVDVADVVVRAADHGVDVRLVLPEHRAAVVVRVRVRRGDEVDEEVVVRDERHPDRNLAFVDSVDPVHRRHELRGDAELRRAGAADGDGVLARRREREPVGLRSVAPTERRGISIGPAEERTDRKAESSRPGRFFRPLAPKHVLRVPPRVAAVVRGDEARRVSRPGIDVPGAERGEDHGGEAPGADVETDRGGRVVDALAAERPDLGELRGQLGRHHRRLDHPEQGEAAVGVRQLEKRRGSPDFVGSLHGDPPHRLREGAGVKGERAEGPGPRLGR